MGRHKKTQDPQLEQKSEVKMSQEQTLDTIQSEIDLTRMELEKIKVELEEKRKEVKVLSVREVSEDEMIIIKKSVGTTYDKSALKTKIELAKQYDNEKVTGKFMNRRAPGQPAKLTYMKYADDPVKWYTFEDGKVYTLPRGFADQLNGGSENDPCYYTPRFIQKQGDQDLSEQTGNNSSIAAIDSSNKKYAFVPISF